MIRVWIIYYVRFCADIFQLSSVDMLWKKNATHIILCLMLECVEGLPCAFQLYFHKPKVNGSI